MYFLNMKGSINNMKRIILSWIRIVFVLSLFIEIGFADEYRDFTSASGQKIRGKIIKCDTQRKKIYFRRDNKKQMWIAPAKFCKNDQKYISDWTAANRFMSPVRLTFSIKKMWDKTKGKQGDKKNKDIIKTFVSEEPASFSSDIIKRKYIYYEVGLKNGSNLIFDNVRIEYKILLQRKNKRSLEKRKKDCWITGTIEASTFAKGSHIRKTKVFALKTIYQINKITGNNVVLNNLPHKEKVFEDDVKGIIFKIYGPMLEGKQMIREVCLPKSFSAKYGWSADTKDKEAEGEDESENKEPTSKGEYRTSLKKLCSKIKTIEVPQIDELQTKLIALYASEYSTQGKDAYTIGKYYEQRPFFKYANFWYKKASKADSYETTKALIILYSSSKHPEIQNATEAIECAKDLLKSDKKSCLLLDLLARGYARNAQFALAVKTEEKAIKRLLKTTKNTGELLEYRKRLELYKNKQPFTMEILDPVFKIKK